jgi:hypothetical protein
MYSSTLSRMVTKSLISESAATLEAESGYSMESPDVSQFRQYILDGLWSKAEMALERLGVQEDEGLWVRRAVWETRRK